MSAGARKSAATADPPGPLEPHIERITAERVAVVVPVLRGDKPALAELSGALRRIPEVSYVSLEAEDARLTLHHTGTLTDARIHACVRPFRPTAVPSEGKGGAPPGTRAPAPLTIIGAVTTPVALGLAFGMPTAGYVAGGLAALGMLALQVRASVVQTVTLPAPGSAPTERRTGPLADAVRKHKGELRSAAVLRVLSVLLSLLPFAVIATAINTVFTYGGVGVLGLTLTGLVTKLTALFAIGAVLTVLYAVFGYLSTVKSDTVAHTITHELRMQVYEHVQSLPISYFEDNKRGSVLAELGEDVNGTTKIFEGARTLLELATKVIVVSLALIVVAPPMAWLLILFVPLYVHIAATMQRLYYPLFKAWSDEGARLASTLSGNLDGIATIKSMTAEREVLEQIREASDAYATRGHAVTWIAGGLPPILDVVIMGTVSVGLLVGAMLAASSMSAGAYAATILLTQQLLDPLSDIGTVAAHINRGFAAYFRAMTPLSAETEPAAPRASAAPRAQGPLVPRSSIVFEDVGFAYASRAPIFEGLDLAFPVGTTTGLVGSTGSGKSTIAKLLLRFHEPSSGRVLVDGEDVRDIALADLRRAIGVVSQDLFLFDGDVLSNLRLGNPHVSEADVFQAARTAGAHDFIEALPAGYRTRIGERGTRLSGGQRQRIAIARALLRDTPILLFDEATSHVDNQTEALLQRSLEPVFEDRTVILIAHRLSTVQKADNIYVLNDGEVVEQGTHDALLRYGGAYSALWRLQVGGKLAAA